MMQSEQIKNEKLDMWVELDPNEVFPSDPGQGTPVLVCLETGETATWACATQELEVDGVALTKEQAGWLMDITPVVEAWMQKHGA